MLVHLACWVVVVSLGKGHCQAAGSHLHRQGPASAWHSTSRVKGRMEPPRALFGGREGLPQSVGTRAVVKGTILQPWCWRERKM